MSASARLVLGLVSLLLALGFVYAGSLFQSDPSTNHVAAYALAIFCVLIAVACLIRRSQPITLRILGVVVLIAYTWYVVDGSDVLRALVGLVVFGLPAAYVVVTGKYPSWGKASAAFRGSRARNGEQ